MRTLKRIIHNIADKIENHKAEVKSITKTEEIKTNDKGIIKGKLIKKLKEKETVQAASDKINLPTTKATMTEETKF